MKLVSRRIRALLLVVVTITGLLVSFGENVLCAGDLPGTHEAASTSPVDTCDRNCPCTPTPADSPDDHFCTGDCGCPCQAPLASAPMAFSYSPAYTTLSHAEPARYIPEVYLSLFVPPDIAIL